MSMVLFQNGPIKATSTGLVLNGSHIDDATWEKGCLILGTIGGSIQFMIGDWLNALRLTPRFSKLSEEELDSNTAFDETITKGYEIVARKTGYAVSTVREFRRVARLVPLAERHPKLTFSHYSKTLASIDNPARAKWTKRAITKKWSSSDLASAFLEYQSRKAQEAIRASSNAVVKIGKPTEEETSSVRGLISADDHPTVSLSDIKRAIGEDATVQFRVVLTGLTKAVSDPDPFFSGHPKRDLKNLLMKLQDLEALLAERLEG